MSEPDIIGALQHQLQAYADVVRSTVSALDSSSTPSTQTMKDLAASINREAGTLDALLRSLPPYPLSPEDIKKQVSSMTSKELLAAASVAEEKASVLEAQRRKEIEFSLQHITSSASSSSSTAAAHNSSSAAASKS